MTSKQIPAVGEAFLGSDPQALKVTRVTFGDSAWSGGNDVDVTTLSASTASGDALITFGDSGIIITNIAFHLVESFSAAFLMIGPDSAISDILADSASASDTGVDFTQTAGVWWDMKHNASSGTMAAIAGFGLGTDFAMFSGEWPVDSDDSINVGWLSAGDPGIAQGHAEMYVYYLEAPIQ